VTIYFALSGGDAPREARATRASRLTVAPAPGGITVAGGF
jgi:hypothetical protein